MYMAWTFLHCFTEGSDVYYILNPKPKRFFVKHTDQCGQMYIKVLRTYIYTHTFLHIVAGTYLQVYRYTSLVCVYMRKALWRDLAVICQRLLEELIIPFSFQLERPLFTALRYA